MSQQLLSLSAVRHAVCMYSRGVGRLQHASVPAWRTRDRSVRPPYNQHHVRPQHYSVAAASRPSSTGALSAEDRLDIAELCVRFDEAMNTHDHSQLVQLFSPEGSLVTPKGTSTGHSALLQYLQLVQPMAQGNRHLSTNVVVTASEEEGRANCTSYRLLHRACNPPTLLASGTIRDKLVKLPGGSWRFLERRFEMDPPATPPPSN